jgi:hypothetical protein
VLVLLLLEKPSRCIVYIIVKNSKKTASRSQSPIALDRGEASRILSRFVRFPCLQNSRSDLGRPSFCFLGILRGGRIRGLVFKVVDLGFCRLLLRPESSVASAAAEEVMDEFELEDNLEFILQSAQELMEDHGEEANQNELFFGALNYDQVPTAASDGRLIVCARAWIPIGSGGFRLF